MADTALGQGDAEALKKQSQMKREVLLKFNCWANERGINFAQPSVN